MKKIFIYSILTLVLVFSGLAFFDHSANAQTESKVFPVRIFLFYSETCPHCHDEIEFLENLKKQIPNIEVHEFEVSRDFKNQSLFSNVIKQQGLSGGVPVTIIGSETIVGFDDEEGLGREIISEIKKCSTEACPSELDRSLGLSEISEDSKVVVDDEVCAQLGIDPEESCDKEEAEEDEGETARIFGSNLNLSDKSVVGLGVVLGLADGINPCMFSVLIFLLTYLLAIGSRKRAIKAGIAFVITTFVLYFLFMLGIIKVIDVLKIAGPIRLVISLFAFVAGVIMIKDFFLYGKGISLEISEKAKPTIERLIKKGTVPSAILLALFAGLVELPCTSGIPLAYVSILTERGLDPIIPLIWYNFFFIIPILAIVLAVIFAWAKVDELEEKRQSFRKWMRLISGVLLVFLALAMWFNVI